MRISPPKSIGRNPLQEMNINASIPNQPQRAAGTGKLSKKLLLENDENLNPNNMLIEGVLYLKPVPYKFSNLPIEIMIDILLFGTYNDIISSFQLLNHSWKGACKHPFMWRLKNLIKPLSISKKYIKLDNVVERRSKGKLFKGISRIDSSEVMIRKVFLDVANAGLDDGIPSSILREFSYQYDHPRLSKIKEVEIIGKTVQIVYPFYKYNLREYIKVLNAQFYQNKDKEKSDTSDKSEKSNFTMDLQQIKKILYQVLEGLSYLHSICIMHRNIKPENIVIDQTGNTLLIDFVLSRQANYYHFPYTPEDPKERDRSGREANRLWYRAPELLIRTNKYSFEIDIWSTGCLFAELAGNEPLFTGESEVEQLMKIFRMLGKSDNFSSENAFPKWNPVDINFVCLPKESEEFKALTSHLLPNREKAFLKLMKLVQVIGKDGINLLSLMLDLNPHSRITASQALLHPFFKDIKIDKCKPMKVISLYPEANIEESMVKSTIDFLMSYMNSCKSDPEYMKKQPSINENMRSILVDWLIDVSVHFELTTQTLHLAISYIDRALSSLKIEKNTLQLLGVTSMKIADLLNEKSKEYYKQENASEYAYITAEEYTPEEVVKMEKKIVCVLNFNLMTPTFYNFVNLGTILCNFPPLPFILTQVILT